MRLSFWRHWCAFPDIYSNACNARASQLYGMRLCSELRRRSALWGCWFKACWSAFFPIKWSYVRTISVAFFGIELFMILFRLRENIFLITASCFLFFVPDICQHLSGHSGSTEHLQWSSEVCVGDDWTDFADEVFIDKRRCRLSCGLCVCFDAPRGRFFTEISTR